MSSIPRPGSRHETELPVGPDTGRQPETSPDGRPLAAEVRGLVKTYGGLTAVAGIDFEIRRGEIFALLGPNGAGKTTTVEILEGYRARDGGQVTVLGCDPGRERAQLKNRIGIMLQSTGVEPYLTVHETVSMCAGLYPHPRPVEEVLGLVELTAKRDERVVRLSGGQQRRLDMAIALAGDPELLFLDEPTTGFDPSARREAWDVVKNLARAGQDRPAHHPFHGRGPVPGRVFRRRAQVAAVGGLTSASGRRRRPVPPQSAPTRGTGCSEPDSAPSWPYVEGASGSRQLMRGATCERGPRTP